ncbi:EAL domain-containing protein [Evansella sp. AB-rgal1]|uniref:EAL domain-containing protein n=1 Tax=Evansella sp. AB-rgal1 TaxID=3242696 RepID=UPI00359CF7E2
MKIKQKALIIIITGIISLLVFLFIFINPIMMRAYEEMELEMMEENISRLENAINNEANRVSMIVRDYAVWDDSYNYINTRNNQYIVSNWVDDTFKTNKIDLVIYYDANSREVYQKGFDFHQRKPLHMKDLLQAEDLHPFMNKSKIGFIVGNDFPILLTSHRIYPSSEDKDSNGTLIMGVVVDEDFISRIGKNVLLPVELEDSVSETSNNREISILNSVLIKGSYFINYLNSSSLGEYHFTLDRNIVQSGKQSLRFFYMIYIAVSSMIIFIILFLMDKQILSKIAKLSYELAYIQETKDLTRRVIVNGKDEVANLQNGVNQMLESLHYSQQEIKLLAITDDLTGLPNKKYIIELISQLVREEVGKTYAILFLDIDLFKRINDMFGHHNGDYLLKTIASRIKECLNEEEVIARWGGDEFVIVLKDRSDDDISKQCKKILEVMSVPIKISYMDFVITTSIGISQYPSDSIKGEHLIQNADIAMYEAKRAGKNQYMYYKEIAKQAYFQNYVSLENDLKLALSNNEFSLHYQPIVNNKNVIIGVEALLRWNHPIRGVVPPGEFIHVAEEIGIMPDIGAWVLEEGLRQVKKWHNNGFEDLSLSVNVSKTQLMDTRYLNLVGDLIELLEYPPHLLRLEITESDVSVYLDKVIELVNKLHKLGVITSLDDFGTGQSSLMYLKEVKVSEIKIDRHFVKNIPSDNFDKALLSGIIKLCKKLNIDIVAEGVETLEQLHYLSKYNINMQGYYFNRPLPNTELEGLLENKRNSS